MVCEHEPTGAIEVASARTFLIDRRGNGSMRIVGRFNPRRLVDMAKAKKKGDSSTPKGSPEGPPGKKQKSRARRSGGQRRGKPE
jgi:hypothetical protein